MNLFKRLKEKATTERNRRKSRAAYVKAYPKEALNEIRLEREKVEIEMQLKKETQDLRKAKLKKNFGFITAIGNNVKKNLNEHSNKTRASFMNTGQSPLMQGGGGFGSGGINSLFNQPQATASKKKRKKKVVTYYE